MTSHGGKDFTRICEALAEERYRFGAVVIDAALFLPQSRPRLFIIAVSEDVIPAPELIGQNACELFHTRALCTAQDRLSSKLRENWIWWRLPAPGERNTTLAELIEDEPKGVSWHSREETQALVNKMSEVNLTRIAQAKKTGRRTVGTLYRRTRYNSAGEKVQRAEARFDGVAGCLRTPAGGSSRQFVVIVEDNRVRSRLISMRETARLMGLPDEYILPEKYNEAYHLTGDGVVVPAVRHIAAHVLEPLLRSMLLRAAA